MAKRGGGSQFQTDIQTDDDLEFFTDQSNLCDVYTEWCGPCLGMHSTLKKIKADHGDSIQLAICKADTIEALARFRNRSEPTWLFVTKGRLFNILFGTDIPNFKSLISTELKRLQKIPQSELIPIREMLPIEKQRFDRIEGAAAAIRAAQENKANRERKQYLNYVQDKILSYTSGGFGVTLFGPQVTRDHLQVILKVAEDEGLSCQDRHHVILQPKHIDTLHFQCKNPIPDEVLEQLYYKELLVCYWKGKDLKKHKIEDVLNEFVNKLTKLPITIEGQPLLTPILEPLDIKIKRVKSLTEIPEPEIELDYRISQNHDEYDEDEMEGEQSEVTISEKGSILTKKSSSFLYMITVPPAWTPINAKGTATAIYVFFRNQTTAFLPPDPVPEPPHLIMAFDAWKRRDVTDVMNKFTGDILEYGYFTTEEPETATLLAKTTQIYEKSKRNRSDKLILKVAKRTSHTVLAFAAHGPTYVSPNIDIGKIEANMFFPEGYNKMNEEEPISPEPIPEQKSKEPVKEELKAKGKEEVKGKGVPAKAAGKEELKAKDTNAPPTSAENINARKGSSVIKRDSTKGSNRTSNGSKRFSGSRSSSKKGSSFENRNSRPSRSPPPT